jgi:hypothetical protein
MKNILLVLSVLFATVAFSQSTSPRWGTTAGRDNSYRGLQLKKITVTDEAGADSTTLAPSAYNTLVAVAVLDSFTFKSPTVTKCSQGDEMTLLCTGTSGDKVKFTGTNWVSTGTATLSSGLKAIIRFIFDGAKWVEASRVVQ